MNCEKCGHVMEREEQRSDSEVAFVNYTCRECNPVKGCCMLFTLLNSEDWKRAAQGAQGADPGGATLALFTCVEDARDRYGARGDAVRVWTLCCRHPGAGLNKATCGPYRVFTTRALAESCGGHHTAYVEKRL